MKKGVVYIM